MWRGTDRSCRYFKFGEGTCPFSVGGTLSGSGGCMYAHTARDGKPIDGDRLYMGADGELQRVKTYEERDRDRETPPRSPTHAHA